MIPYFPAPFMRALLIKLGSILSGDCAMLRAPEVSVSPLCLQQQLVAEERRDKSQRDGCHCNVLNPIGMNCQGSSGAPAISFQFPSNSFTVTNQGFWG